MRTKWIMGIVFLIVGIPHSALAQPDTTLQFPIQNNNDPTQTQPQSFDLGDPSDLKQTIVYDPATGTYVFRESLGDLNFRNPSMMTLEEYLEYERQKSLRQNWKDRIDEQTAENQPMEFPIKIGSKAFENFFGSDEITIRPQGSVELSFGVNSSRYDNPILPVKQRRITRFDFNQQIQMNLVGQIGTKLKIGTSYNTQAAFDFDNISKLEYTGDEDQIMQKIELGNVALQLPTSLIQGSQTLFGAKTQMKFGRSTVDLIAASSKGKRQEINISGKAQVQRFELSADNYEANRHYFLNLYHHQNYDQAMSTLPIVSSTMYITRMEVWLTNRTNNTENTRNIIAFSDLGEAKNENWQGNPGGASASDLPDNEANGLYNWASNQPLVRGFVNSVQTLSSQVTSPGPFQQAIHYEKVENARKLTEQEYSYNALLGYVSLNLPLNNDEVLAVAYEYTYRGETYQVGEFSTDGASGQEALLLKLLRPTIMNPNNKIWDLMMKNVYSIGAYQVDQAGFRIDLLYNNPETSLPVPFLSNGWC
jgi:cell surface protein SprA